MTRIAAKITIIAGLAMLASLGTAVAGATDAPAPSNPPDAPLTAQPNAALHESDCQAIWSLAAPDNDRLSYDKATPYVTDLQAADPDNDGYVDKTELWMPAKKGVVHSASGNTAIPKSSHVMLRKKSPRQTGGPAPSSEIGTTRHRAYPASSMSGSVVSWLVLESSSR